MLLDKNIGEASVFVVMAMAADKKRGFRESIRSMGQPEHCVAHRETRFFQAALWRIVRQNGVD